jgi:phosphatidylinositol-3-phosphatase
MIRRLAQVRVSRLQLGLVALASAIATVLVAVEGTPGETPIQAEVLAALHHRGVVVHDAGGTGGAASGTGVSDPGPSPGASAPTLAPGADPTAEAGGSTAASTGDYGSSASGIAAGSTTTDSTTPAKTYKVKHVFVISLSTTSYAGAFGQGSVAQYLNRTLVPKGTLLRGYRSLGDSELSDQLAMVSGQAPNADTSANCATYAEFPASAKPNAAGLVPGAGCIYPDTALTIGDQVTGAGKVWKAYIEDMGSSTCVHPNSGALDDAEPPGAGSDYDTRHNPFIYFHSLLDLGDCSADDEALTQLSGDLGSASNTPAYTFVAPGLCDDSSQTLCASGQPGGLAGEDAFLKQWVPAILRSSAYKHGGALIITFTISTPADAGGTGTTGLSGSTGPTGSTAPTAPAPGPGHPVQVGALVLSPYTVGGRTVSTKYDPYSVLRSVEDLFGFTPLGHAKQAKTFLSSALPRA